MHTREGTQVEPSVASDDAQAREPEEERRPSATAPAGAERSGEEATARPSSAATVVLPPNRNGYAVVVGRILDLIAKEPPSFVDRSRTAVLSRAAEGMLKDADPQQLGAAGLQVARHGTQPEWRAFVRDHFERKYHLHVLFDAAKMNVR